MSSEPDNQAVKRAGEFPGPRAIARVVNTDAANRLAARPGPPGRDDAMASTPALSPVPAPAPAPAPAPVPSPLPVPAPGSASSHWQVVTGGPTALMGIVNVTPDSFSDGGRWGQWTQAVVRGLELVRQGADIIDVGGESTRPGAARVSVQEELDRVLPTVSALASAGVLVSVDTMRAEVARASIAAGALIINDVSGGLADPGIVEVVAEAGVVYIAMHWRGHSDRMADFARYDDVVADVVDELSARVEDLVASGIRSEALVLDPGLGFSKVGKDNWRLLAGLERLADLGHPLLVGASRKRFLGELLHRAEPEDRDAATMAVSVLSALSGAWAVRVHEVAATWDAFQVMQAYERFVD